MLMAGRLVEILTDHSKVTFVLGLLKEAAANWATLPFIEGKDLELDNYQDFIV